jgi:hypothetical protein
MNHFESGQIVWISANAPHHAGQPAIFRDYVEDYPKLALVTVEHERGARYVERYIEHRYLMAAEVR